MPASSLLKVFFVHGARWTFDACDLLTEDGVSLKAVEDAEVNAGCAAPQTAVEGVLKAVEDAGVRLRLRAWEGSCAPSPDVEVWAA